MEPFRPLVDFNVARLVAEGAEDVTSEIKANLANVLSLDMTTKRGTTPVSTCLERLAVSLATAFEIRKLELDLPEPLLPLELPEPQRGATKGA
jgi:CRISPR-associated protein Cas1